MKRLLIIRSASIQQLDININQIKESFKGHEIFILTHPHTVEHCKKYSVKNIIPYESKNDFNFKFIPKELKNEKFDSVIFLVSNISGKGYLNLILFSFLLTPKSVYYINIKSEIKKIYKLNLLFNLLKRILYLFLILILIFPFTTILLIVTILNPLVKKIINLLKNVI